MNIRSTLGVVVALGSLLSAASPSHAQSPPPNLDFVMRAMMKGPKVNSVKIHGHKFNIKPAKITRTRGGAVTAKLHISHTYKYVRDDQVYVTITKVGGKLQGKPQIKIKYRGWKEAKRVAKWAYKIGKWIYKNGFDGKDTKDPRKTLQQLSLARKEIWALGSKPKWEAVANALINEYVMRMGANGENRMPSLLRRVKQPAVIAFRDGGYKGPGLELYTSSRSVRAMGLGDSISSIRIPRGCTVTLYEHANYRGRSVRLTGNVASLKKLRRGKKRWHDCVSSIRISRK